MRDNRRFKNYFITGDYVVGGVGLRGLGVNGIATRTITIGDVPPMQTSWPHFCTGRWCQKIAWVRTGDSGTVNAKFKGNPLTSADGRLAKVLNAAGTAPCWSSGGGTGGAHRTYTYRADVLRFFDVDTNGRFIVNGAHQVQVPDSGPSGNAVPIALGASLVVVYRDPTMPLNAIVIYDSGYTMDQSTEMMTQTIKGFYAATTALIKITHIVGSGQANKWENLRLPGGLSVLNPFTGSLGASWDSPTFESPTFNMTLSQPLSGYADSTATSVDHVGFNTFDCLTWGATVLRATVQDTDGDGLLDPWEESTSTLYDPNDQPLPNLKDMGADKNVKDLFVGYMHAGEGTTYGSVLKPLHSHLPTPEALKMVGDAFKDAPVPINACISMWATTIRRGRRIRT